jgi:DNA-binding response OmpR family regulator
MARPGPRGYTPRMAKILIVDDEKDFLTIYREFLEKEGFTVVTAACSRDGLLAAVDSHPDVIVCDVSMPGGDGVELCRALKADRRTQPMPVILMSGVHKKLQEQIHGIELGADDYLPKPFSPSLLATKVRALLRRRAPEEAAAPLRSHGLVLDQDARLATLKGRRLPLTRKEFDLLTLFVTRPGHVMSAQYLLETVWGYDLADYNDPHTVGVHVSSLRKKLGPPLAGRIVAVPALGYRFDA